MLHETSSRSVQAWSMLNGITQSTCHPHVYTRKVRATPGNLHQQSSTAVTHCLLIATHFTDPRKPVSSSRVPPGVEPGPLASEASVLPHSHLLPS